MTTDPTVDKSVGGGELILSQCQLCKHRIRPGWIPVCEAFPSAIPQEVLDNAVDHRKPIDGDDGIRFAPRPDVPAAALASLTRALDALA